jgi:hypothetical protein
VPPKRCGPKVASQQGSAEWIDRAVALVRPHARSIFVRGDTDFSLTGEFDRWDDSGVKFVFGMDASPTLVNLAESLAESSWQGLGRMERSISDREQIRATKDQSRILRCNLSCDESRSLAGCDFLRQH